MDGGGSNNSSIDEEELERYCIGGVDLSCRRPKLLKKKIMKKTDRRFIIAKLVGRSGSKLSDMDRSYTVKKSSSL